MARSKKVREQHRTSVSGQGSDARAQIIVPVASIESADDSGGVRWSELAQLLPTVWAYPARLVDGPSRVALVLDDFAFDLHLGDRFTATGTHDGPAFRAAALEHGVDVYLADDIDVRRSSPADLDAAAADGRLLGARVSAFRVLHLEPR